MIKREKFSGWQVAVGAGIIMFMIFGVIGTFAIFMPAIAASEGWSISSVSIMIPCSMMSAFVMNLLVGNLMKKFGIKLIMIVGVLFGLFHIGMYSQAKSVLQLCLLAVLAGFALAFATSAPASAIINNWFIEKKSTVISVVFAAAGFGTTIFIPTAGRLIDMFGWRTSYIILSAMLAAVALPASIFLLKDSPEKYQQKPFGWEKAAAMAEKDHAHTPKALSGMTLSEAKSTSSFWLLLICMVIGGLMISGTQAFLPSHWQLNGISPVQSSNLLAVLTFTSSCTTILLGPLTEKFGVKIFLYITTVLFIGSTIVVTFTGYSFIISIFAAFLMGTAGPLLTLGPPFLVMDAFGPKYYSQIIGFFTGTISLGSMIAAPLVGVLFAINYTYVLPFLILVGAACIFLVLLAVSMGKIAKNKQRMAEAQDVPKQFEV